MKKIVRAEHAGFCFGVNKAVNTAYEEIKKASAAGEKLYCLGDLIHNAIVTEELKAGGLVTVQSTDEVPCGSRLLIRAHGEPGATYEKAAAKNCTVIDATCPFVAKIHRLAAEAEAEGRFTCVAGDGKHPEVIGILGSTALSAGAVYSAEAARAAALKFMDKPLLLVAQTTVTKAKFDECASALKAVHPDVKI